MEYSCPIHGPIPEENQMNSAGGKFCGESSDDTGSTCMEPLEIILEPNANASK